MLDIDLRQVEGFLMELDDLSQKKALELMRRLEQGVLPFLPRPHGEKIEKNLYALRISSQSNPRLYYTVIPGKAVFLTGYYKKSPKIPRDVLELCRKRIRDLKGR